MDGTHFEGNLTSVSLAHILVIKVRRYTANHVGVMRGLQQFNQLLLSFSVVNQSEIFVNFFVMGDEMLAMPWHGQH